MPAACPQCGESLIGAVNRCWKCGCSFLAPYRAADHKEAPLTAQLAPAEPPVAAALAEAALPPPATAPAEQPSEGPLPLTTAATVTAAAQGLAGLAPTSTAAARERLETAWVGPMAGEAPLVSREYVRRGSPFDPRATPTPPRAAGAPSASALPSPAWQGSGGAGDRRVATQAALGGVWGSLFLGAVAVLLAPWRAEGALVALVGLGMGVWGLQSPRRNWAGFGLLLCALGLVVGVATGAIVLDRELKRLYGPAAGLF